MRGQAGSAALKAEARSPKAERNPRAETKNPKARTLHRETESSEAMKVIIRILAYAFCLIAFNSPRPALSQISLVSIGCTNDGGYASAV